MAKPNRWPAGADGKRDEQGPNVVPIRVEGGTDPLDSFTPEVGGTAPSKAAAAPRAPMLRVQTSSIVTFAALVAIGAVAAGVFFFRSRILVPRTAPAPPSGHVVLNSRPAGAAVLIDGVSRGTTPLELELPAGAHEVIFRSDASERRIDIKVDPTTRVSEAVDMPTAAASTGVLEITSEPSGARVSVDGSGVGVTPITLNSVTAAKHAVVVSNGGTSVIRSVDVTSGTKASVFVALAQPAPSGATGTFAVESPLELRILENGQLLGLSNAAPIVVSTGRHQFDLINESLELRVSRQVTVDAGKPTRLSVTVPNGTLSVNAVPWAEVFVDGKSIGVTPLGAVAVAVGSHEVVWRHPQLGEKRRTVIVGAQSPSRVSMDMSK
jgi:hypothetical protein